MDWNRILRSWRIQQLRSLYISTRQTESEIAVFKKLKLQDYYVDRDHFLQMDRSQDCELLKYSSRSFIFRKKFLTCDPRDYAIEVPTYLEKVVNHFSREQFSLTSSEDTNLLTTSRATGLRRHRSSFFCNNVFPAPTLWKSH